jgi:predicted Zn finger-like uncharacterized protein
MLIVCPSCATSYDVEPTRLEPDGRQVRCVRCRTVWHAAPNPAAQLLAAAAALGPGGPGETVEAPAYRDDAPAMASASADPVDETEWSDQAAEAEGGSASEGEAAEPAVAADAAGDVADTPNVEAPPIVPVDLDAGRPPIDIDTADQVEPARAPAKDVESYAARFARRAGKKRRPIWSLTRLQTAILALIVVNAVIVGWRRDVVRMLPQTASFYALLGLPVNLRGLVFADVTTSTEEHEGVPILVVQGTIINRTSAVTDVPSLKIGVRNAAKQEIYAWTAVPPRPRLSAYQAVPFRTRLASPPPDAADVLVRFVTRRDLVAAPR